MHWIKAAGPPLPACLLPSHLFCNWNTALMRCPSSDPRCSHSLDPGWCPGDLGQLHALQHQCRLAESPSSSCWPQFRCSGFIRAGWKKRTLNQSCGDLYLQLHPVSEHIPLTNPLSEVTNTGTHLGVWECHCACLHVQMREQLKNTFSLSKLFSCFFVPGLNWIYTDFFCLESLLPLVLDYDVLPYISRHVHPHWVLSTYP